MEDNLRELSLSLKFDWASFKEFFGSKTKDILETGKDGLKDRLKIDKKELKDALKFNFKDTILSEGLGLPKFSLKLQNIANGFITALDNVFKDAISNMKEMLGTSYLTNNTTWTNVTQYGMSIGESWAFEKTKDYMNIQSEDQMYRMTDAQWNQFMRMFQSYTDKYNSIYDSGLFQDMQEYEWTMKEFKEEMTMTVIQWFSENKDTVKKILEGLMKGIEFLGKIITFLVPKTKSAEVAAYSQSIADQTRASYTSITMNAGGNTYNNVDAANRQWIERTVAELAESVVEGVR